MKKLNPSTLKESSYSERIYPARDWHFLLRAAVLLLLVGIAVHLFLFWEIAHGKNLGKALPTTPAAITTSPVGGVQALFQKRAAEQENYQNTYTFVDPSLPGS